jgi:CheY-like chemotaxis protein
MKAHDMPTDLVPLGKIRVLIVDSNGQASQTLANILQTKADYETQVVKSNFETGLTAQKFAPHALLINLSADGIDAGDICKTIRSSEELQTIKIIAIAKNLGPAESTALLHKGFDGIISDPGNITEVIRKIEEATAIIY